MEKIIEFYPKAASCPHHAYDEAVGFHPFYLIATMIKAMLWMWNADPDAELAVLQFLSPLLYPECRRANRRVFRVSI
jgi:hypothetical protein